jgi:hypothetical protein
MQLHIYILHRVTILNSSHYNTAMSRDTHASVPLAIKLCDGKSFCTGWFPYDKGPPQKGDNLSVEDMHFQCHQTYKSDLQGEITSGLAKCHSSTVPATFSHYSECHLQWCKDATLKMVTEYSD